MKTTNEEAAAERLAILRRNDHDRTWISLDDRRCCVRCAKVFSGREILITPRKDGKHELHCPTEDCDSFPIHWFFQGSGNGQTVKEPILRRIEVGFLDL